MKGLGSGLSNVLLEVFGRIVHSVSPTAFFTLVAVCFVLHVCWKNSASLENVERNSSNGRRMVRRTLRPKLSKSAAKALAAYRQRQGENGGLRHQLVARAYLNRYDPLQYAKIWSHDRN